MQVYIVEYSGNKNTSSIKYEINGNILTGKLLKGITAYDNIVIRLKLPEGYFVNAGYVFNFWDLIYFGIPIIFTLYCFIIFALEIKYKVYTPKVVKINKNTKKLNKLFDIIKGSFKIIFRIF